MSDNLLPIDPALLYPLEVLKRQAGLGRAALSAMRRGGMRMLYVSGRCYVHGQDFINYVLSNGKRSKDE